MSGDSKAIGVAFRDQNLIGSTLTDCTLAGTTTNTGSTVNGTSAAPTTVTAAGNVNQQFVSTSAASGDSRLSYNKLTFTSTGSGETTRSFTVVQAAGTAVGGTVNGTHTTLSVDGSGTVSGAGNALRATIGGTSTNPGGTLAAIQADSDFATGGTWTNAAFLRFTNSGTGLISYLMQVPTTGSGLMFAPHTTEVMTDSIRIKMADGNVRYIMCTTLASNRTGGA